MQELYCTKKGYGFIIGDGGNMMSDMIGVFPCDGDCLVRNLFMSQLIYFIMSVVRIRRSLVL